MSTTIKQAMNEFLLSCNVDGKSYGTIECYSDKLKGFLQYAKNYPQGKVFADSVCAPLNDEVRNALEDLFNMRWPDVSTELSADDLVEFQRLCLLDPPDFILNLPDYYAFLTHTMFWGKNAN